MCIRDRVWDDFEGDYGAGGVMLVNDLDLELEAPGGSIYYPWTLDPDNPSLTATTGVDHLNNVEQVEVSSPTSGTWTVRVTATVMPEPNQDFSVVTSHGPAATDPPPDAPTGLDADPGTGEGEIDVGWDPNSEPDLDYYVLERADNPAFSSSTTFNVYTTSYTDSGLTPGQTYYYRVFAVDEGANMSDPSGTASSDAQDLPPAAPTGLVAVTGAAESEIDISWNPNSESDLDHYRLERDDDGFFGPGSDPFDTPATFFPDSGLVPGATYYYRVIAVDAGGNESGPSNVDSAAAQDLPPAAPTGLVAIGGAAEGEISTSWNPNSEPDLDHYVVQRDTDPAFPAPFEADAYTEARVDGGLTPGQLYYYRVIAVDTHSNASAPSVPDSAVATDLAPSKPTGLSAAPGLDDGDVDVDWNANPETDIDHYWLERDTTAVFGAGTSGSLVTGTSTTEIGLPPDTYYYRVTAVDDASNESAPSDTVSVTLEETGIEEVQVASLSFIRPNPFRSETGIRYTVPTGGSTVTIRLYDIRGRLVRTLVDRPRSGGAYETVWDGRDDSGRRLSAGVYFCRAEIGEWTDMRKMVLIR